MSNRERWIIYPLLFFSLLSGLKDQFALPTNGQFESITCKRLTVEAIDGRPLIELDSNMASTGDQAGVFVMYGSIATDAAGHGPTGLELKPRPRTIEMGAEPGGGYLKSFGDISAPTIKLGHDATEKTSGVAAIDTHGHLLPASANVSEQEAWGMFIGWKATNEAPRSNAPSR